MGLYDRDYYRENRPEMHWFTQRLTTPWLVVFHVGVFVLQLVTAGRASHGRFTDMFMLDVARVQHGEVWRVFTGLFIHDIHNWLNVVWNVLIVWFFGRQLEEIYGGRKFLLLYLLAGLAGNLTWVISHQFWPMADRTLFGAAPAITFVLMLCTFHYPRQTVLLFFVLPLPLWVITALYVGKDLVVFLRQVGGVGDVGVAIVHVAGAAFAVGYYYAPQWRWNIVSMWSLSKARPSVSTTPSRTDFDEQLEAQADAILDKLNRQGKDALTPAEWEILHRASEAYRRRR